MIEVYCPHCNGTIIIEIEQLNCKIFRHGVFKKNGKQINPHEKKNLCDEYKEKDLIYGCGKPFIVIVKNDKYTTEICDYI